MTEVDHDQTPASIDLTALEFDVLWEHLRPGRMPLAVKVPSPGRTHEERTRLAMGVWSSLAERALGRPGALDEALVALITALGRPDVELDGRLWLGGREIRVIAAISGETGVRAVLDGGTLSLTPVVRTGLTRAVLDVLPARPPGLGSSVTLRSVDLDHAARAAGHDPDALTRLLTGTDLRASDAQTLGNMVRTAGDRGQFGSAARNAWGRRLRAPRVVAFFDTPSGRYLQSRREAPDGTEWSTVAPAGIRMLHHQVEELLTEPVEQPAEFPLFVS
ncbi:MULTISPECIES: ESX secretion-associated protein EspG [Actinoalloteichus]|uniref:EspG family n=1 Tax=Actinoalloteichus fjordicus TaxID=1612552 RepID=A0AAC9LGH2_9PSEU|nr:MULTISPECIES: ESX secretion-associated protein EspG [Actinoalloteichus]APU17398.1 EspG family [Actinoalloteichus fjordicus]APU23482.1 EspG family [Actinoalloteichus sp. GBA129-24]